MTPPRRRRGGPRQTAPTLANNAPKRQTESIAGVPVAAAVRYLPSGRRRLPLDVVTSCPYCPWAAHVHRAGKSPLRRAGCCSRWYIVAPTIVRSGRSQLEAVAG
jgi:hypothetical protein